MGQPDISRERPFAKVLVKTGVFHLDEPFDYAIPANLSEDIEVGSRVIVSFRNRKCEGFVIERSENAEPGLKIQPIEKNLGNQFPIEFIPLLDAWSQRWGSSKLDILRFSLAEPVAKYRKIECDPPNFKSDLPSSLATKHLRMYWQLPPLQDEADLLFSLICKRLEIGSVLVVVPEERFLQRLEKKLKENGSNPVVISSNGTKTTKYENFIAAKNGAKLVIGTRSASLSPNKYTTSIVWREDSEHHFELHSPGWNSRDASLIRSAVQNTSIIFTGYVPSVEIERLIENGYVSVLASAGKVAAIAATAHQGEILPTSIFRKVKSNLKQGPVLFLVPTKGYGNAISCAKCRNIAVCKCGGKLSKSSKGADPKCVVCATTYPEWRCTYCGHEQIRLIGRGIDRISAEIGAAFPGIRVFTSTAERELSRRVLSNSIVLATNGMAANQSFKLTVILDGHNSFCDLRAEERFYSMVFRYGALAENEIAVIGDNNTNEVAALNKWSSIALIKRLNRDRSETGLPPYSRLISIFVKNGGDRIFTGFQKALEDGRIGQNVKIFANPEGENGYAINLFVPIPEAQKAIDFIYEFQKKRSLAGKELIKYRVDPYSLG